MRDEVGDLGQDKKVKIGKSKNLGKVAILGFESKKGESLEKKKAKNSKSYQKAVQLRDDYVWRELGQVKIKNAVEAFLKSLEGHTLRAYGGAFRMFLKKGLLDPEGSLQFFAVANLEHLLDLIKERTSGSEVFTAT